MKGFLKNGFFQIISILFFLIFLLGSLNIYFSDKNNYCVMTYMFEYPQFVRISVPENVDYPQYGLYAYSEGRLTERARKMWFDGIPVLYLPGNFGSHKQCRSFASVALRKALSNINDYHFDYFTVDYDEQLSGLYGGVLGKQTEFAAHCIHKILSLYKHRKYTRTEPSNVILIGHSMGGLIVKRLLTYDSTVNVTKIGITLAAPLQAPVFNFDSLLNDYYIQIQKEWANLSKDSESKLLLSFGNGIRDVLVPSGLTGSAESDINALAISVPGVWVSPDHVSIVWCKQFVMAVNKFLFSIVDLKTKQVADDKPFLLSQAKRYFQANRSMTLNPSINRPISTMVADGFWYEDNRRMYQVSRPEITKTTYLMIRLVSYHQNRFVAVEGVNIENSDWLFGCNANEVYGSHRYCKTAMSLNELSRWTGAANNFGKRRLATVHLHNIMEMHPRWSHVIIKLSPTKKPVKLNVDINDHASREITVDLPSVFSFSDTVIKQETERDSIYYELVLPEFNLVHQTYYLYVKPTASCKAIEYHSSAEMHVPWAENNEYFHYFTHTKQTPMKLRLYKNNPNVTKLLETTDHVRITLLLDPQCTYKISISPSLYHQIGQFVRYYSPLLIPYVAAIIILVARSNFMKLHKSGTCVSVHSCLMSDAVKPYYVLVGAKFGTTAIMSVPILSYIFETASSGNTILQYFYKSLLSVPIYLTALGIVNIVTVALLGFLIFSSQLANRLLFRLVFRGGGGISEHISGWLQRVPAVAAVAMCCAVHMSCGAAALAAGTAFYAFILSKMYEEYLQDYIYKLMAKVASKLCFFNKRKNKHANDENTQLVPLKNETPIGNTSQNNQVKAIEESKKENVKNDNENPENDNKIIVSDNKNNESSNKEIATENKEIIKTEDEIKSENSESKSKIEEFNTKNIKKSKKKRQVKNVDEELSGLNFHMMMFMLWLVVTLTNVPALITWARDFKHSMVLKPDTSYFTGMIMSVCAGVIWQIDAPPRKLKYYELLSQILFVLAILILVLAPLGTYYINYLVTAAFLLITIQQTFDNKIEENDESNVNDESSVQPDEDTTNCECDENKIFNDLKNIREKTGLTEQL